MPAATRKIRIAEHIEVEWLDPRTAPAVCPNCGASVQAEQILDIDYRPPKAVHRFILQICPACTARFVDNMHTMDYSTDELIEIGWNVYQVQLGAGVWPISAPLTRVNKPPGAKVLEIGGAYGFGLDFCIRARGWQGVGYDPSPLAAFGARELGLDIKQAYFTEAELTCGPWDVAIATEVLEHLEHPPEFLALMRKAMADGGLLVLTTPDAEHITPALDAGSLMPLLSPGAHLVLQTATSLELALRAAGFAHVVVLRSSLSLVAYASPAPFTLIEDTAAGRAMYRRYLVERSKITAPGSDLCFGFAGRGLFEAANDGDAEAVEAAWNVLLPAAKQRFGLDLAAMRELPAGAQTASLAELARLMPLGLGMILFGRVNYLLGLDTSRAELLPLLRLAGEAVNALQAALAKRSLTDGLSASIGHIVEGEILLCQAEAGEAASVAGLIARGDVVDGWRGFVALVNADALELAGELKAALLADMPHAVLPDDLRCNALLSLANFVLAPGGETMRAFAYADALRDLGEDAGGIVLQAFTRLVNASRYGEALDVASRYGIDALAARAAEQKTGQDARLARMVLDLAVGDPGLVRGRVAGVELAPERRTALLLGAYTGLINTARYDEAEALAAAEPCFSELDSLPGAAADDARLASVMLDLHFARTQAAIRRIGQLEQAGADLAVLRPLLVDSFVRLVNESKFTEAAAVARDRAVERRMADCKAGLRRDALAALLMLELQQGDGARIVQRLEEALQGGLEEARMQELELVAFVTLVNAGDFANARLLRHLVDPLLQTLRPPYAEVARNALFAAGVLFLEQRDDWRRSATCFARLRDELVRLAPAGSEPDALFWPALRGELVALNHLKRGEDAAALLNAFAGYYPGAPDDLLQQMESPKA